MIITNAMISMVTIVTSLIAGGGIYYIFNEKSRGIKLKQIEEVSSVLINFVLLIWLSKVILNFSSFLSEPLTILAYPGASDTFYLAFIFSSAWFMYRYARDKRDRGALIETFSVIFLLSSIVHELIQLVWNGNPDAFGHIVLAALILIVFLILEKKVDMKYLLMGLLVIWSAGMMLLSSLYPVVTVFGYTMLPDFIVLFFIVSSFIIIFTVGKEDEL